MWSAERGMQNKARLNINSAFRTPHSAFFPVFPVICVYFMSGRGTRDLDFMRTQSRGDLVENGVDVLVAVLGAEGLGQLHGLVADELVGYLGLKLEFVGADAQARQLDRGHVAHLAVQMRGDVIVQLMQVQRYLAHQMVEVLEVAVVHLVVENEMGLDLARRLFRELPLIQR